MKFARRIGRTTGGERHASHRSAISGLKPFCLSALSREPAIALLMLAVPAAADDWPFFRGPNNNGVSVESGWRRSGRRPDRRSPGGQTSGSAHRASSWSAIASSRWVAARTRIRMSSGASMPTAGRFSGSSATPASSTPASSRAARRRRPRLTARSSTRSATCGQVHCLGLADGRVVWRKHLVDDFGGRYSSWKYAGSPLVTGDLVIFDTGADGNSTVALDKTTGRKVWGVGDDLAGYATPIPFEHAGQRGVLVFKARAMVAHDLQRAASCGASTGGRTTTATPRPPRSSATSCSSRRATAGGVPAGRCSSSAPDPPRQIWLNQDLETKMNSAVVYEGHVYCVSERSGGQLMCFDLRDGTIVWAERSFAPYGTLMIADGKLVVLDEKGELVIADATPAGYHELARAKVLSGRCWVDAGAGQRAHLRQDQPGGDGLSGRARQAERIASTPIVQSNDANDAKAEVEVPTDGHGAAAVGRAADGGEVDPATAANDALFSLRADPSGRSLRRWDTRRTSPHTTPRRCRACRAIPRHWAEMCPPRSSSPETPPCARRRRCSCRRSSPDPC